MSDHKNDDTDEIDYRICSFEQWVEFYFDIKASNTKTYEKRLFQKDIAGLLCVNNNKETLEFFTRLFENPINYLTPYTNVQMGNGLWHLTSMSSQWTEIVSDENLPWKDKKRVIYAIYSVYEQLFEPRCSGILAHLNEIDKNPLNSVCYMWWDIIDPYNQPQLDEAAIDVMERTLKLKNIACLEGALHGLGHYQYTNKERVQAIIDQFLADNPDLPDTLRQYALNARQGNVQ